MFYQVTTTYTPLTTHQVELFSPLSGRVESLTLTLYIQEINNSFVIKRSKKPMGVFQETASEREIPASHWTQEMVDYYESVAGRTLVPHAGRKLSTWGKIWLGLFIALLLVFAGIAVKTFTVDKWQKENAIEEVLKKPVVGDEYRIGLPVTVYDASGKPTASGSELLWCKILSVEPGDIDIYRLKIEGELPEGTVFTDTFSAVLDSEGTFHATLDIEQQTSSWPKISFLPIGGHEKYSVFFYGTIENAKRPAK